VLKLDFISKLRTVGAEKMKILNQFINLEELSKIDKEKLKMHLLRSGKN
jgi:hypothetical protein